MVKVTKKEFKEFVKNVDGWVKENNDDHKKLFDYSKMVVENANNVQHDYELINEIREQIDELRRLMKILMLASLKQKQEVIK